MIDILTTSTDILAQVPDPGAGEAPPGSEKFLTILRWAAWLFFAFCVAALLGAAGKWASEHVMGGGHGRGGGAGILYVIIAAIIGATASGLIGAVV